MTSENKPASWLDRDTFRQIVAGTPLISIDLIVRNEHGQVLLGQRLNRPAQGYWFVPGGRVRKDERLADAFYRLTQEELGLALPLSDACFLGPFEHFYNDNFSGSDFSTHYVVLGYAVTLQSDVLSQLPEVQHGAYRWFDTDELMQSDVVHVHTKLYFCTGNN